MSIKRTAIDRTALPAALLPLAKEHLRVDWAYDDAIITSCVARAIDWFGRKTDITVFRSTYEWKPAQGEFYTPKNGGDPALCPITPVETWAVDLDGTDVSADYDMVIDGYHGVELWRLEGVYAAGMMVAITSGYETPDDIPPGILDVLFRYTSHLYEHREVLVQGHLIRDVSIAPGWEQDVLGTYWKPRV